MSTVSVSALKANLSRYLREVRRGGEVQVLDRGTPVATLAPPTTSREGERARLVASGLLRPGAGAAGQILDRPLLELPADLSEALDADREDRL